MIETDSDRRAMLQDYGDDCVVRPAAGGSIPIRAISDQRPYEATGTASDYGVDTAEAELTALASEAAGFIQGDRVEVLAGELVGHWHLKRDARPIEGGGFVTLPLMRDSSGGA